MKEIRPPNSPIEASHSNVEKHIFISDLKPQDIVRTSFLVRSKEVMQSRNGKPYLALTLSDRTGAVDTRVWEDVDRLTDTFGEGDVVAVFGKTHYFQNRLQLVVDHLVPIPATEIKFEEYLPSSGEDLEALYQELLGIFEALENPWIRKLSLALLTNSEIASRYKICPAAKTIHHAFIGGLLTHSLQLIKMSDALLACYSDLDRELIVFGCAFHDFGKIYELSYDGNFGYTDEGRLVGHITIGATLVDREIRQIPGFPKTLEYHLKHLILSHHGKLEHGSPKRPCTLEALFVHYLDDLDSKINSIQTFMKAEKNSSRWTAHHKPYDQYYYKPDAFLTDEHQT